MNIIYSGTRNVVAECLGKLTLIHPTRLLPELKAHLQSASSLVRSTVVTAAKFTITDQAQPIDCLLREHFGDFLDLIEVSVLCLTSLMVFLHYLSHYCCCHTVASLWLDYICTYLFIY